MYLCNFDRLFSGKQVGGEDAFDRRQIGRRVRQRVDSLLVTPEGENEPQIRRTAHHATQKAILLVEHWQGDFPRESLVGCDASRIQAGFPKTCDHIDLHAKPESFGLDKGHRWASSTAARPDRRVPLRKTESLLGPHPCHVPFSRCLSPAWPGVASAGFAEGSRGQSLARR